MNRPALELADIFRRHGAAYRQSHKLPLDQLRLMRAIELCRTAALGGHVEQCDQHDTCDHIRVSYNSCSNRHCPKCGSGARAEWVERRKAELLPIEYFHVVFTVPEEIAAIAFYNKKIVYDILFRASAETLLTIARDPQHLGAEIGFFSILHTWGQNLLHHPHVHCVVSGGGLSADHERWISCRPGFLLPVRVLSCLFRRRFLEELRKSFAAGELRFFSELESLCQAPAFAEYLAPLANADWVVYAQPPFGGALQVLEYLGRYTQRVALSNERLTALEDGQVSFQWKDYRQHNRVKTMTLEADEFIRRFLLHTLPAGFQRIRHYGYLANCHRRDKLALIRLIFSAPVAGLLPSPEQLRDYPDWHEILSGESPRRCPRCGIGTMVRILQLLPHYGKPLDSS
jgi:hypothetical protein